MGEMADMALDYAHMTEEYLDEYVSGGMSYEEAYDHGFVDESGCETAGVQAGWDRSSIPTLENVNNELREAEKDFMLAQMSNESVVGGNSKGGKVLAHLNEEAIANLSNETPTCNCCRNPMQTRDGKFGKFYYCSCPEQGTVSDKYWQSIKNKHQ